jgi:RNA-directed DNA polymerase (EC 2.7.7.49)
MVSKALFFAVMAKICRQTLGNSKEIEQVAMNISKTLNKNQTVEWKDLNWRKLEKVTFKLQKRIFQASERGDVKAVRKLQSYPD